MSACLVNLPNSASEIFIEFIYFILMAVVFYRVVFIQIQGVETCRPQHRVYISARGLTKY
jgi:hypothetical protein